MPDGDVIPNKPVRLWRRPYDLICSGSDPATVSQAIHSSLLKSLRDKGGLPGAADLASVVSAVAEGRLPLLEALHELREVEWRGGAHLHTRVAAQAVAKLLVELSQGSPLDTSPLRAVLDRFSWELIRYQLLGRLGPDQQGVSFSTYDEYLAWERQYLEPLRPQVDALVSALERDSSGLGLRHMPVNPTPARPQTAGLLETDLLLGELAAQEV